MNPQCASWYQCYHLALRYHRRSTDFSQQPSQLEIDACLKAYELGSDVHADGNILIGNTVQMAKLYADLLFNIRRGSKEHQETSDKAIKFAR